MSSSPNEPVDLLDLKLLPAWVKGPSETRSYAHYEGEEGEDRARGHGGESRRLKEGRDRRASHKRGKLPTPNVQPPTSKADTENRWRRSATDGHGRHPPRGKDRQRQNRNKHFAHQGEDRPQASEAISGQITVRFLPHQPALENVIAQIKANPVAYSIFALARLFLEKPERYDVSLTPKPDFPLHRLGENGTLSADRQFLENIAFRFAQEDFYRVDVTQSDPIKGNFSNVARCRLSGVLLGPTNHHGYQPKLRNLYEQRFSRRMSFPEYQRQVEIVNDPAVVEQWKEEARKVTTFTTLREESPSIFGSAVEAERHFRQNYLPGLVKNAEEATIDGITSRKVADRTLRRLIEDAWSRETRSPSQIMQELAKSFREAGLHIFRHRRGMLFVSPIRTRPFTHDQTSVSAQVKAILETLTANLRANRKELAEKLLVDISSEDAESRKLALASDLHWLISEGYVIEFNDGSLDLPRAKLTAPKSGEERESARKSSNVESEVVAAAVPAAGPMATVVGTTTATIHPASDSPSDAVTT